MPYDQFFFKKSRDILDESGNLNIFAKKLIMYLFILALPVFIILFFLGEAIFQFVFGNDWVIAGNVASKLSIFHFIAFPISPVSSIFLTLNFEKRILIFQIFLFSTRFLALVFCAFFGIYFLDTVLIYSIANAIAYFILHIVIKITLKKHG
jgi:lipopolysaccharide exporter